jgi:hypothetical protein
VKIDEIALNPAAFNKLKPGEFVYVDLIPCDKDAI